MALAKSGFKYQKRDGDAVKKRAEQEGGNFDSIFKGGVDTFRAKQGTNTIRFLPPTWEDPEHYGLDIWVHQYVGADSGSYLCPKKMLSKHCPICAAQKEANDAGEEEEAKQLRAVKKVAAWIIDRDDRKPVPKIWLMSWTMDRDIATLCHSERTGKTLMLDDPDGGYDLSFKRTGQQLNTRYLGIAVDRDSSPLFDEQKDINKIMALVEETQIPDTLLYKDEKYLEAVISGKTSKKEKDPQEDDDPPPRRRASKEPEEETDDPPPRRRAAREEEVEEERPSARRARAEPEEADDPPPRRRSREPEPEAEDDPPPRRRAREPEPEEADDPPPRRRAREPEPEADDPPPRRRAREPEEADDPPPRRRAARDEPEPEADDPPPRRRAREPEPEEEADDPPPRRRAREPEPEDDPPPRRRVRA